MNFFNFIRKTYTHSKATIDHNEIIDLYPNPTSNTIQILFYTTKNRTLNLYDNQGNVVLHKILNDALSTKLDLQDFPSGIYALDIDTTTDKITKHILKE